MLVELEEAIRVEGNRYVPPKSLNSTLDGVNKRCALWVGLGDHVADAARCAVARVEILALVDEVLQLCLKKYQLLLVVVHIRKFRHEKAGDVAARHLACLSDSDDASNFGQRQTSRLGGPNEPQAREGRFVVSAITVSLTFGGIQQAAPLIKPDGLCGCTTRGGQVSNLHTPIPPLDLALRCNVYGEGMDITLQYFEGCPNWNIAAERLAVVAAERPGTVVIRRLVENLEDAESIAFRGSPSILVGGTDLFPDPSASVGLACRIYTTPTGLAGAPTLEQLRDAIATA